MHFEFSDLTDVDLVRLHLSYGQHNAQTKKQLAVATGIEQRTVEETLRQMTLNGEPVVSNSSGYWLGTDAEIERYIASLRGRLITQYQRFRALRSILRAHRGYQQQTLWQDDAA